LPSAVAVADFDGDGSPDLAVLNTGYYDNNLRILLNDGTGRFHMADGSPFKVKSPSSLASADFNRDGKPDLAVTTADGGLVLLGDNTGRLVEAPGLDGRGSPALRSRSQRAT
jgi:hypothetical protein